MNEDPLTSFEARLASLQPRGTKHGRDELMYLAGQASVVYWPKERRGAFWPVAITALIAIVATTLVLTATASVSRIADAFAAAAVQESSSPNNVPQALVRHGRDEVQCRVEVGNSLGMFFSFLVGRKPVAIDPDRASQSLVHQRAALLKEEFSGSRARKSEASHQKSEKNYPTQGEYSQ